MPQHYIKIEIKGDENNLPKEAGEFITYTKTGLINPYLRFNPSSNFDIERWLDEIEWYLIPEHQQPEQQESIREISKKIYQANHKDFFFTDSDEAFHKGIELGVEFASQSPSKAVISDELNEKQKYLIEITAMLLGACILTKDEIISELTKHAKLILENASQSYEAVIMPTDQAIKKNAKEYDRSTYCSHTSGEDPSYHFIAGAKWFRSQVREVELKGELERIIIDFINGRFKTILFSTASKKEVAKLIVDDYLSARKEEENERE